MKKRAQCKICKMYLSSEKFLKRHYKTRHKDKIET
ncbi:MAG: hypothetical protein J4428_05555 [Candidatus Aenigmarchaeota archaeon]|nr:hypothetical protein [Candidatus Aenigmarchaeota archaeon]